MVGLHIVLRNFAFIDLVLFRQEVYSKRLLKQRITPVFFVPQYSEFDTKPQGVAFRSCRGCIQGVAFSAGVHQGVAFLPGGCI